MMKYSILLLVTLCLCGVAKADATTAPGDFHLISRDRHGIFVGSHKLFQDEMRGTNKVSYCRRTYFVRSHSVAWVQLEIERGHTVQIEYNFRRGWRPVCNHPELQVTLSDLGISISAKEVLASVDESASGQGRLSAIGAMFQAGRTDAGDSSYHTR